jgi:NADH-quinone oxidoreductase subunit N
MNADSLGTSLSALNWLAAAPEVFLLIMACVILLGDVFMGDAEHRGAYALTLITLACCAVMVAWGGAGSRELAFYGMYVTDALASLLKLAAIVAVALMLVYSHAYLHARKLWRGELFALALFALLGIFVMLSAANFVTLYLGLELLALSQYAMVALQRDSKEATEAAMKYFVLGALASGLLLYGLSMLYGATGSLDIAQVAQSIAQGQADKNVLVFGVVFVVAGLAFKLGAVPFHMWVPDVYQGAPTPITLFLASAAKFGSLAIIYRLLAGGLQPLLADWQGMLVILAVLSMALGNLTAIAQSNLKRMLAYSTIAHMGFLLIGVLAGNQNGYSSAAFYTIVYALTSSAAFAVILLMSRSGFEADQLDDLRGLNQRAPWYAFMMLIVMFSLAGIPPTVGFYAKLSVLQAALEAGYVWLVVAAVLFSLIGAFYYLRIVRLMYFEAPSETAPLQVSGSTHALISVNGLALLVLGILPGPLMAWCVTAVQRALG